MAGIAPWLSVKDAARARDFYLAAFGASELERLDGDAGDLIVARLSIHGADFWIAADDDAHGRADVEARDGGVRMILSVDDPDAVFARAIAAGAAEISPMHEDHGWRIGRIADPSGHHWEIGRRFPT
jgi:PhnB protein